MKSSCIINNFNYHQFIPDAVASVLNQTIEFDEIIIVDDCSTDDSTQVIHQLFGKHENIQIIFKDQNEGQLSCFNAGFLASTGDVIFFLDADDIYHPYYHEIALNIYKNFRDCDFLACQCHKFSEPIDQYTQNQEIHQNIETVITVVRTISQTQDTKLNFVQDLGYSILLTTYSQKYIGSETSGVSMRRNTLNKILPFPFLNDWRTRADDVLVFGSSLVGARKYRLNLPLVGYRIHGKNSFAGNRITFDKHVFYRRKVALNRLFTELHKKMSYGDDLADIAAFEFKTISNPNWEIFGLYAEIILKSKILFSLKTNYILILIKAMLSSFKEPKCP